MAAECVSCFLWGVVTGAGGLVALIAIAALAAYLWIRIAGDGD